MLLMMVIKLSITFRSLDGHSKEAALRTAIERARRYGPGN